MSATTPAVVVWGIPSCTTVKKARNALEKSGIAHTFRDLRGEPPTAADVARFVEALSAKALRNTSGGAYRALPAEKDAWSDAQWTAAYVDDPMLIKRPVIERDGAPVAVGFRDEAAVLARLR